MAKHGCFLTFETSSAAVTFALRLQQIHHFEADLPGVRVGVHMGEVSARLCEGSPRVEGLAVDLAARVCGLAVPGQVSVSASVQQSAKQRLGISEFGQPIVVLMGVSPVFDPLRDVPRFQALVDDMRYPNSPGESL